jgi:hypothetical protein
MTTQIVGRDLFGDADYRGVRGSRARLMLRFLSLRAMPENTRNAYLYKFQDEEGNKFNWFTNALKALEVGKWYQVTAVVGKPKRFRGEISTRLKDCRIGKPQ